MAGISVATARSRAMARARAARLSTFVLADGVMAAGWRMQRRWLVRQPAAATPAVAKSFSAMTRRSGLRQPGPDDRLSLPQGALFLSLRRSVRQRQGEGKSRAVCSQGHDRSSWFLRATSNFSVFQDWTTFWLRPGRFDHRTCIILICHTFCINGMHCPHLIRLRHFF